MKALSVFQNLLNDKYQFKLIFLILENTQKNHIMKAIKKIIALCIVPCLAACSMYAPNYFGTKYSPTETVKSYYATKDIDRPFEVIGHMNARTGWSESSQERTRKQVIQKAKQIGADGVVFSELNRQVNEKTTDDFTIKVEVIKFK